MCYLLELFMFYFYILTCILVAPYMLALIETVLNFVAQCYSDNKGSILFKFKIENFSFSRSLPPQCVRLGQPHPGVEDVWRVRQDHRVGKRNSHHPAVAHVLRLAPPQRHLWQVLYGQ